MEDSIRAFQNDLKAQNWDIIYKNSDINEECDDFLGIFNKMYDKNCPIKEINHKEKICTSSMDHKEITKYP